MALIALVLSVFALAAGAPFLHRLTGRWTGVLLALLPAVLAAYFLSEIPSISDGETISASRDWVPSLDISLSFRLDGLSLLFVLMITGIGALVLVYSGAYLAGHEHLGRFYLFILTFMGAMLGLVLADDVLTLFVFWELTSVSSYLLIGFEHGRERSRRAALQALLVTSSGGLALLAGLLLLAQVGGSSELSTLVGAGDTVRADSLYVPILLLVLVGAFTKSAQVPFHFWLPNAMEAPAPVSAYLHSATMVKAGIYLLARLSPVLGDTDTWLWLVSGVGALTMIVGVHLAMMQTDLKRILAYSTMSVLGQLTMLLGIGAPAAIKAAIVVLLAHAMYKGALFLVAGTVDHETGSRDIRSLRGLRRAMPATAAVAVLAAASMAGIPPLVGFIAKESLYEAVLESPASTFFVVTSVVTSILLFVTAGNAGLRPFVGEGNEDSSRVHEGALGLWVPAGLLAVGGALLGIVPGLVDVDLVSPATSAVVGEPASADLRLWHGLNTALALSALTIAAGVILYAGHSQYLRLGERLKVAVGWGADEIYDRALAGLSLLATAQTRLVQSGYLRAYVLVVVLTVVTLVGLTLLSERGLHGLELVGDVRYYEFAVVGLIVAGTVLAIVSTSRLAAVASLGVVGYGIALIYLLFGAPDLAMAQILVETLIVIVFVLVLYHLPRFAILTSTPSRLRDAGFAIVAGALMTCLVLVALNTDTDKQVSEYYAETSKPEARGRNVVNVILVDFRSLDTLGEITVLAVAGMGVFALLKLRPRPDNNG